MGLIATLVVVLLIPATAQAHVKLRSFAPAGDKPLATAPTEAVLVFSTDVEETLEDVIVTAPDGSTPKSEPKVTGERVVVPLPKTMDPGTWTVEYVVLGADGHPIRGTNAFSVKTVTKTVADGSLSAYPLHTLQIISLAGRIIFFLGLLLFVGGGIFALYSARGFVPAGWGAMAINVTAGAIAVIGTHNAILDRRSLVEMLDPRGWIGAAASTGGRGYALAAIAVLLALKFGRPRLGPGAWRERQGKVPLVVAGLLALAAMAPTLSSHAMDGDGRIIRVPLDMLHIAAGAAWIGGLVQLLALTLGRRAQNPAIPSAVARYSRIALGAVITLVLTGTYAAWNELGGRPSELIGSTYGRLVLFKLLLLAATIPFAKINKDRHMPNLSATDPETVQRLRRFVTYEFAIVVWVVVATAALVYETPPGESGAGAPHGGDHSAMTAERKTPEPVEP